MFLKIYTKRVKGQTIAIYNQQRTDPDYIKYSYKSIRKKRDNSIEIIKDIQIGGKPEKSSAATSLIIREMQFKTKLSFPRKME